MQKPSQSSAAYRTISLPRTSLPVPSAIDARDRSGKGKTVELAIDGAKTLLEQQAEINYAEQTGNFQLVCYRTGSVPVNLATVKQVPKEKIILPLFMVELPVSAAVAAEVASQLGVGRHLVFYTVVHVKGVETKVAGFR